jgi:MSHA biogenesis protein MshJ
VPILLNPEAADLIGSEDQRPIELASVLYQHNLKIEFRGDFFSTYQYLRFLEEISASLFWDSLRFEQVEWPSANVVLKIHTLSTEKGFIGA